MTGQPTAETQLLYGDTTPLAVLRNRLVKEGARVKEIAEALYAQRNHQVERRLYSQERWCENGSDTEVVVRDGSREGHKCVLWCVNHYTGLNRHPSVIGAAQRAASKYGTGAGTSGMSGGMCSLHKEVERKLAERVKKDGVLLFPTGYSANLGLLSTLPQKGDLVLFDRECHASIIDGIRMSPATWCSFPHNDAERLRQRLSRLRGKYRDVFVVVESAYSMSGDLAPIRDFVELKREFDVYLYVDEAHTFGFYGPDGGGYVRELGLSDDVDFLMSTLSKATASIGGFFAGPREFVPFLQWCANPYIFQACLTPPDAAAVSTSLDLLRDEPGIAGRIHENNAYMRAELVARGFDLRASQSPIIPIYVADDDQLIRMNAELFDRGVFSVSVVYPAVKSGEGRVRLIVTGRHTKEQIDFTVDVLEKVVGRDARRRPTRSASSPWARADRTFRTLSRGASTSSR